jgi:hypothetical protein
LPPEAFHYAAPSISPDARIQVGGIQIIWGGLYFSSAMERSQECRGRFAPVSFSCMMGLR